MSEKNLTIRGRLVGLNDYVKACRTNKYVGAKLKQEQEQIISIHVYEQLKGWETTKPVFLHFTWYEPNCKRDLDNISFAKKFILDTLVKCGVIKNDGWKYVVGFTDEFVVDSKFPHINVSIKEVE